MTDKKRDNRELYVFIGIVSLIFFVGYDGFFNDDVIPKDRNQGGSKSRLASLIMWTIWKLGEDYLWLYITFRGIFLVITLWMGYKIYKAIFVKK